MQMTARTIALMMALSTTGALAIGCATTSKEEAKDEANGELQTLAVDSTGNGPLAVTSSEYRLPASTDPDILPGRNTEVWAHVWRPADLVAAEKHPVLVFLHGNHATCGRGANPRIDDNVQYTNSGTCPAGYVVVPNHMGYAYVAERMASWGYIVVSINANRGITAAQGVTGDGGLNLARGRLVLKHLELLSSWNKTAGTTPASLGFDMAGMLDLDNVGLMGHSRGGEGVRAAYTQYHDPGSIWPAKIGPLNVKAISEIGPVDGQTGRQLNALGTAWNVILPMCDGDVSNLQGMKPFDRMLAMSEDKASPKATFAVWGANHNYYNTEWQQSDSRGCSGGAAHVPLFQTGVVGSTKQLATGLHAMMGLFRAHVGTKAEPGLNNTYDPQYGLPDSLTSITRIGRAYADGVSASTAKTLEDFTKPAGTSLSGEPEVSANATVTHGGVAEHDPMLKAAAIKWTGSGDGSFYQIPFAAAGSGVDASAMKTIDLRVGRANATAGGAGATNFSVALVNVDGSLSGSVKISEYVDLVAPGGHITLDTARIPLADFKGADLSKVAGIRLVFNDTADGAIFLSNVRISRAPTPTTAPPPTNGNDLVEPGTGNGTVVHNNGNHVQGLRSNSLTDEVEVELESADAFPVMDDLVRLRVGNRDVIVAGYAANGDTHRITFTMSKDDVAAVQDGADMTVRYGEGRATQEWSFGKFSKSAITR